MIIYLRDPSIIFRILYSSSLSCRFFAAHVFTYSRPLISDDFSTPSAFFPPVVSYFVFNLYARIRHKYASFPVRLFVHVLAVSNEHVRIKRSTALRVRHTCTTTTIPLRRHVQRNRSLRSNQFWIV